MPGDFEEWAEGLPDPDEVRAEIESERRAELAGVLTGAAVGMDYPWAVEFRFPGEGRARGLLLLDVGVSAGDQIAALTQVSGAAQTLIHRLRTDGRLPDEWAE